MRKHATEGRDWQKSIATRPAQYNGSVIEQENLFGFAVKRHKLTEHLYTAGRVTLIHHNPSIAKYRRRDSQLPHALDPESTIVADRKVVEDREDKTSERREEGSNIERGNYVGVWLALRDFDRGGGVNGAWGLSSPEPATQGELVLVHYFFFCFLGGVTGRPVLMPP